MEGQQPLSGDEVSTQVREELSQTPFACSSLEQLGSRPDNFVYRGILIRPLTNENGTKEETVIVKHCKPSPSVNGDAVLRQGRETFEKSLFEALSNFSPRLSTGAQVRSPRLYMYDQETGTQISEDFRDTLGFKAALFGPKRDVLLPESVRLEVGHQLGSWLRSFHNWASAPEQAALRQMLPKIDYMRTHKRYITYDHFIELLKNYPELVEGREEILQTIRNAAMQEFEKPQTEDEENWGLIHADTWSGNMLLPARGWQSPSAAGNMNELFVIDWEYAQFGHRAYDLGQLVGDLCERKLFNGSDISVPVVQGIIKGYGALSDEMAFRVAIHVGVHCINWSKRRPKQGPWVAEPEAIVTGLAVARDFAIKGWEKDKAFFKGTLLESLFIY